MTRSEWYERIIYSHQNSIPGKDHPLQLSVFTNNIHFDDDRQYMHINVDYENEYFSMYKFLVAYEEDTNYKRQNRYEFVAPVVHTDPEFIEMIQENYQKNRELYRKLRCKYDIDGIDANTAKTMAHTEIPDGINEPFINVLSGSKISFKYGEGILDFIYADFETPLRDVYRRMVFYKNFIEMCREELKNSPYKSIPPRHPPPKTDDFDKLFVEDYIDYKETFEHISPIAYASAYSAIFPPRFHEFLDYTIELDFYVGYLQYLQKTYLEIIEFCYDEDFFPDVLGHLYPSERYALYRESKGHSNSIRREEEFRLSTLSSSGNKMPFGITGPEHIAMLTKPLPTEPTEAQRALAERINMSPHDIMIRTHFHRFISRRYQVDTLSQMLELEITKMLENNIRFRKCKRCGKYFIMKGNYNTKYCSRITEGETRSCQELAAIENYKQKVEGDAVLQLYNRYYKRYAARARAGSITANSFKKWKYEAVVKRDQCIEGSVSLEEFDRWMNGYFPKKKAKRKK